jgi:hypothetical protein
MVIRSLVLFVTTVFACLGETPLEHYTHRVEQILRAVLRWECLWIDWPEGFHAPPNGSASLAIAAAHDAVSYCSHELGVCTRYKLLPHRNWFSVESHECCDGRSDMDSLRAFLGVAAPISGREPPQLIPGVREGASSLAPGPVFWTATLKLGTRDSITKEYKKMRPEQLAGLEDWLRAGPSSDSVKLATIPCFASADPSVYIYVKRPSGEPYVLNVYWDREREEWILAFVYEGPQFRDRIAEFHRVVQSVACSAVSFQ